MVGSEGREKMLFGGSFLGDPESDWGVFLALWIIYLFESFVIKIEIQII